MNAGVSRVECGGGVLWRGARRGEQWRRGVNRGEGGGVELRKVLVLCLLEFNGGLC